MVRPFTNQEIARLYEAAGTMPGTIGAVEARLWWRALLLVTWDTGARLNELLAVRWSNVDLENATLCLPANDGKRRRPWLVSLRPETCAMLERIKGDGEHVLSWPNNRRALESQFGELMARAGIGGLTLKGFTTAVRSFIASLCMPLTGKKGGAR